MEEQQLHESTYLQVCLQPAHATMCIRWQAATRQMEDDTFRQECLKTVELVEGYRPSRLIVNMQEMFMIIVPDTQVWVAEQVAARYKQAGVQKLAVVLTKDLFVQVSIEQAAEEARVHEVFQTRFFYNEKSAFEWLLS